MKRFLGRVVNNEDPDKHKRVQAQIVGLTKGIKDDALPWAFSLEDDTCIPAVGYPIWIWVDKLEGEDDYDYSRLWYFNYSEETPKEAYEYDDSDAYNLRKDNRLPSEPDDVSSVEYPKNRVIKTSGTTLEYDEGNKRFIITSPDGSYMCLSEDGSTLVGQKDAYIGGKTKVRIESKEGTEIKSGGSLEPMVLGTILYNYLLSDFQWKATHMHTAPIIAMTGPPSAPPPSVEDFKSKKNKVD